MSACVITGSHPLTVCATVFSIRCSAGLCVDSRGRVYVADQGNNAIRMIDPSGVVTTVAGGFGRGRCDGDATKVCSCQLASSCSETIAVGVPSFLIDLLVVVDVSSHRQRL